MDHTLSGFPTAMCAANNKLYLFFKNAVQITQFYEPDVPTSQIVETSWDTPSAVVSDDSFAYITAKNGIFKVTLDDTLGITQINTEDWSNTHALGIHGDYLYAVCKSIYKIKIAGGTYSTYNTEDWNNMACGACYGDYLFMTSKKGDGHLWKYDMVKNEYKSISTGWQKSIAAAVFEKKIFVIAENTWFIDPENGKYTAGNHDKWQNSKACVAALGDFLYAATDASRLWKLAPDGGYKQIQVNWKA